MRVTALTASFLVASILAACTEASSDRDKLTAQIERSVILPANARALGNYERYYAENPDGSVSAVYIVHDEGHRLRVAEACREIDGSPFPCPVAGGEVRLVQAGDSAWVDEANMLPGMSGGGCLQISFDYQPSDGTFSGLECNGPY